MKQKNKLPDGWPENLKENSSLISNVEELLSISKELPSLIERTDTAFSEHGDYFKWIHCNIELLDNALFLIKNKKSYASIYPLIRIAFENYWIILLAMNGEKYIKYFKFKKGNINQMYKKWKEEFEDLKGKERKIILDISKTKTRIKVIYRGLLSQEGEIIPWYYFLVGEYNPSEAYLGRGRGFIEDYLIEPHLFKIYKKSRGYQKDLREDYFNFTNSVIEHLLLNKLINKKAIQKILVHYNFLSLWVHPNKDFYSYSIRENDFYLTLLALIYIGNLTSMFLKSFLDFVSRQKKERKLKGIKAEQQILKSMKELEESINYFWFIHNRPHYFYKYNYCINRNWREFIMKSKIKKIFPAQILDNKVPYYKNPLEILKKIDYSCSHKIFGKYKSPIIRG